MKGSDTKEINIIGYKLPNSEAYVICRLNNGNYITYVGADDYFEYSSNEIEEVYNFKITENNLEKLGWTA